MMGGGVWGWCRGGWGWCVDHTAIYTGGMFVVRLVGGCGVVGDRRVIGGIGYVSVL